MKRANRKFSDLQKTKNFCILPWVHAQVHQSGEVLQCCYMHDVYGFDSVKDYSLGSLGKNSFQEIWNGEKIKDLRKRFLNDEAFTGCKDCIRSEANGIPSPRQKYNREFAESAPLLEQTNADGSVNYDELQFLDIRFSNLCNFKCRTCNSMDSSAWAAEERADRPAAAGILRPKGDFDRLWSDIEYLIPDLRKVYFAGGEPLLEKDHYFFVEKLIAAGRTDMSLLYNTNMSRLKFHDWEILSLWRRFHHVYVSVSLDGTGRQLELLRKGADWANIKSNILKIKKETPHVHVSVALTLSIMNVFHVTEALGEWMASGIIEGPRQIFVNFLQGPEYLNANILNEREIVGLQTHFDRFKTNIRGKFGKAVEDEIRIFLDEIVTWVKTDSAPGVRSEFRRFTNEIDEIRGEKFLSLFPQLATLFAE